MPALTRRCAVNCWRRRVCRLLSIRRGTRARLAAAAAAQVLLLLNPTRAKFAEGLRQLRNALRAPFPAVRLGL